MMFRVTLISLGLAGCAAAARAVPVRGPDGDPNWVSITCQGDPTDCEALAGEACPSGYDIGATSFHGTLRPPSNGGGIPAPGTSAAMWGGHVLVKCHGLSAANLPVAEAGAPMEIAHPPNCRGRSCAPREVEDPSVSGAQRPE
jgi:hypothetical protein